jgi:ligand-binding sensor domain-containing protein
MFRKLRVPRRFRSRWFRAFGVLFFCSPLLAIAVVFWRASHARDEAAAEIAAQSEIPFRTIAIERTAPSAAQQIASVPGFRDVAILDDAIAVSASAGLFLYDRNGALIRSYRAGLELPPAELGAISAGTAAGSSQHELFIATRGEGLLAFDGTRFRQIVADNAGFRNITSVLALSSGRILIGTDRHGLLVFDGRNIASFHTRLTNAQITALAGTDGDLWIGTLAEGLFHERGGELEELRSALPDPQVLSLEVVNGVCYAGTPLGVVEFRDGRRSRTLADGFFARSVVATRNLLHIGTEDEGIVDVPLESRPAAPGLALDDLPQAPILRLTRLENDLYAVTENAILRHNAALRRWEPVLTRTDTILADRNVAALSFHDSRLWVGYFDRGLDIVDASLQHAVHREDDTLFCINRIASDQAHSRTAVATSNGLVLFDFSGTARQILGRKDGLLADHINDVAFRAGGMVVATPAGLSFVDRTGVRSLYVFHGLVNNHVYTVATSGEQVIAGTLGGVSVLNDNTVRANYTTANSRLKHNWITAVLRVGDDWFAGTYGAGVLRLDSTGEWHSFSDLRDGFVVNPNAMIASGGEVYAGTLDRGLFVYDRASGRWNNKAAGLPSKNVTALAVANGYLYAGTDNGLVRINEEVLR